jgi:predicted ribosome-associated RNA-binding protein Tma20
MFKKAIKIGAQNQLSGKDKKTIKSKMSEIFDGEAVECLFSKNEKIISAKVTGSKMLIYTGEEYPIIVDGTGKNDYFPTVYACEAFEPIIKYIVLNEGV